MTAAATRVAALAGDNLAERRRSPLYWGLPIGLMSALIVAIYPSIEEALGDAVRDYPEALREAFGIGDLATVEEYLHAEMLSLIVPLALGYLAIRSVSSRLSGAAESGRLDVLLSAPLARRQLAAGAFASTAVELAAVLAISAAITVVASALAGAGLSAAAVAAGFASVWPLALLFAALAILASGISLRSGPVSGSTAGVLVGMYVLDLVGRLEPDLDAIRYASVFRYHGNAVENGIDPLAFAGVTAVAIALAAAGALLFERRDL